MARRTTISQDDILEAARSLFLEKGLDVPTAEIARKAGVSEGSIFRRFPTKQELFFAAMGLEGGPPWAKELEQLPGGDLQEQLANLAVRVIETFREMLPRMMMVWSCRGMNISTIRDVHSKFPRHAVEALTDFIDRQMLAGKMRVGHPEIVSRIFLGSAFNYVFLETMGVEVRGPLDVKTYATSLVNTLWHGVAPQAERAK